MPSPSSNRSVASKKLALRLVVAAAVAAALLGLADQVSAQWVMWLQSYSSIVGWGTGSTRYFPCRAYHAGGIHPGRTADGFDCHIGYGGQELVLHDFYSLQPDWTQNTIAGATPFGYEPVGGVTRSLYVCRAQINGSPQLGKTFAGSSHCHIPYGGQELYLAPYEVLAANEFDLEAVPGIPLPQNSLRAGYEHPSYQFPCLANFNGGVHPGKTAPGWNSCAVAYGGSEIWVGSYSVLVPKLVASSNYGYYPFVAGREANGSPLGICNASYAGGQQTGKFLIASNRCNFPYAGAEVSVGSNFKYMTDGVILQ